MTRVVTATHGWPAEYRCRVVPTLSFWRRRPGFKVHVDRRWVHWTLSEHRSIWFATEDEAVAWGEQYLDDVERPVEGRKL